jgi:hypothetical protein
VPVRLLPEVGLKRGVITSPAQGWPPVSRDCVSRLGFVSDEAWLHLPPGVGLRQAVTTCAARGWPSVSSAKGFPRDALLPDPVEVTEARGEGEVASRGISHGGGGGPARRSGGGDRGERSAGGDRRGCIASGMFSRGRSERCGGEGERASKAGM